METMPAARYSGEFKEQVVREVIEKERTISSVASSYDLSPRRRVTGSQDTRRSTPPTRTVRMPASQPR
ncbi:MAG: transposase [Corynebacterium matruchotii]|uniref:transposase n=1 Tax=Corynebacterium matruchotii TaxID=43768 RepID=UPI003614169A